MCVEGKRKQGVEGGGAEGGMGWDEGIIYSKFAKCIGFVCMQCSLY